MEDGHVPTKFQSIVTTKGGRTWIVLMLFQDKWHENFGNIMIIGTG